MRAMQRVLPVLVMLFMACDDEDLRRRPPPEPMAMCGDGIIQDGEDCDASASGDATCVSLGFDTGRVICSAECKYDTSLCVKRCGNGIVDLGETCDGTLGVPACTNWGFNACSTDSCVVDTRRCISTAPFEAGPEMPIDKGGRALLGDMTPVGPGDLVMVVPAFNRVEIVPWNMTRGFEASSSRKLSFLRTPRFHELLDANGDGQTDVATRNDDGSFDLIIAGASYSLTTLDGGSTSSGGFLPSNGTIRREAVYRGNDELLSLTSTGVTSLATPARSAATIGPHGIVWSDATTLHFTDGGTFDVPIAPLTIGTGDFDGDGDEDLAAMLHTGIQLYENTGTGFAPRTTFPLSMEMSQLSVIDFDQDGRPDIFWMTGDAFVVRRNDGNFNFTETRVTIPSGPRISLAIGDADGDGDLDVAITYAGTGDATLTRTFMNRVR